MKASRTSSTSAKTSRRLLALALGLGLASAALGTASPASAETAGSAPSASAAAYARYAGSAESATDNKAFFDAVLKSVAEKQAAHPALQSVTVYYNASQAPSFASQISSAASIWNSSVSNVKLQATSGSGDFAYYEGNDSRGSYASTNGHGKGYIFLDYAQNRQYDSIRVTAHETGHVLGLPDHYSGPCSELMSGGGPGTSCTNRYPDANERARVNQLWANGLAKALKELDRTN
ncbi:snapalysin [Streptomyces sp. NPDC006700]|uniref:snapalysin n=1 Tax=unclassified Streptomyces TaxID=2593676 RepID=UPI0033E404C6